MSQTVINNGDSGLVVRNAINGNFTEVYANMINVKNFGATGDGVTDDTDAIKAAVAAAPPYGTPFLGGGGVSLFFPAGVYIISDTIVIKNSAQLIGAGSDNATAIKLADGSDCDMFQIGFDDDDAKPVSIWMQGMRITMDYDEQIDGCCNVRLYNFIRHSNFIDVFMYGATDHNLYFDVPDGFTTISRNNYFFMCAFEKARLGGVYVEHSYNLNFIQSYFGFGNDSLQEYIGLSIKMNSINLKIQGCWFLSDCFKYNIEIQSCQEVVITGNTFNVNDAGLVGSAIMNLRFNMNNVVIANNVVRVEEGLPVDNGFKLGRITNALIHDNIIKGRTVLGVYYPAYEAAGAPFTSTEAFATQNIYNNITEDGFVANYP